MNVGQTRRYWHRFLKGSISLSVLGVVITAGLGFWNVVRNPVHEQAHVEYFTVSHSDIPIVITERGSLEAQTETEIRCEVSDHESPRLPIVFIVPDGSAVKEGDLLVELDSSALREHLHEHHLDLTRAVSRRIQQTAAYNNQVLENETNLAEAQLNLELAKMRLNMYDDGEAGTYKMAQDEVFREILEMRAALELARIQEDGTDMLFSLGYQGKGQLDQARFRTMRAEDGLATAVSKQRKLEKYERAMQLMVLRGERESAERALQQVRNDNNANLIEAEASKHHAERSEERYTEIVARLESQIEHCEIYAPHEGMVVYARDSRRGRTEIREGASVYPRQKLLSLPDPSRMQVKTEIHEAVLNQVRPGVVADIRIDAFPDRVYTGTVQQVAVIPSSQRSGWISTGVKTYEAVIHIDGTVSRLNPGMTAIVEIKADPLQDVLAVPVQAVVQKDRENWCFLDAPNGYEKRPVQLGRSNGRLVHIKGGLAEGDRVVSNPASLEADSDGPRTISPDLGAPEMPSIAPSTDRSPSDQVARSDADSP
jgi:multidrug efflux pump subunit AcrA (membrane-fusion protein)